MTEKREPKPRLAELSEDCSVGLLITAFLYTYFNDFKIENIFNSEMALQQLPAYSVGFILSVVWQQISRHVRYSRQSNKTRLH